MKKFLKIILMAIVVFTATSCTQAPGKNEAFIISKEFVEKAIKRPDIKFPFADFRADDIKNGGFIVESKFTATNDAGVKQEVNYRVKLKWNGGSWSKIENWTLEDIKVW